MARSLTDLILDAHAPPARADERLALRPDHAVAAGDAALLVLAAFAATGCPAARPDVTLVCADSRTALEALGGTGLQHAAAHAGARFAPPALGRAARVHLERYAAPMRLAAGCGARLAGAGGVGMLALAVGAVEMAALWAGSPHGVERPRVVRVALEGAMPEAVGAVDLMLALAGSARAAALRGCVLEFGGPGVAAVPVEERVAAASLAPELGVLAVLWPADEATRAWLTLAGRESDWKRAEAEGDPPFDRAVDLSGLEPSAATLAATVAAGAVREAGTVPVAAVVLGAGTPPDALARLARALAGRVGPPGAALAVIPARRAWCAALEAAERPAEVQVVDPGEGVPVTAPVDAVGVYFGLDVDELPGAAGSWRLASPLTCVASALAGRLEDARGAAWLDGPEVAGAPVAGAVLEPAAAPDEAAPPEGMRALVLPAPPGEHARGPVLLGIGDDASAEDVLRWGPRLRPLLGDLDALANHVFEDLDAGFAARARALGGGFVVAGERCGTGRVRDSAVLALAALGVRAVLARSFAPAFASRLAAGGVLPLVIETGPQSPETGDELEIPALAEGLVAGRSLMVRNLSRGHGYTARLELSPHDAGLARAGGRLRALSAGG